MTRWLLSGLVLLASACGQTGPLRLPGAPEKKAASPFATHKPKVAAPSDGSPAASSAPAPAGTAPVVPETGVPAPMEAPATSVPPPTP